MRRPFIFSPVLLAASVWPVFQVAASAGILDLPTPSYVTGLPSTLTISVGDTVRFVGGDTLINAATVTSGSALTISGGGVLTVTAGTFAVGEKVGGFASSGSATLTGDTSIVFDPSVYTNFQIGRGRGVTGVTGTFTQSNTSEVTLGTNMILGVDGGAGSYVLNNDAVLRTSSAQAFVYIGLNQSSAVAGTAGTLTLNGNSRFEMTSGYLKLADNLDNGSSFAAGSGKIVQNGTSTVVLSGAGTSIGNAQGGVGEYELNGGTLSLLTTQDGAFVLGAQTGAHGVMRQTGGLFAATGAVTVGLAGAGEYFLSGGVADFSTGGLSLGSSGVLTLSGSGVLKIGGANGVRGQGSLALGGGTITVTGTSLTGSVAASFVAGTTTTFDTAGLAASWSGNLTAAGLHQIDFGGSRFIKTGAGTLTLSGSNVLDSAFVTGGTLAVGGGSTRAVEFGVGSGSGVSGAFAISAGTLSIVPSTRADNVTAVSGSFRVGDYGGTGVFTQTGGAVDVGPNSSLNIGNQGGTGTYELQGGVLTLSGGNSVIGRSSSGTAASNGTLNISGGALNITGGAALINGNNLAGAGVSYGTSSIVQTGGVLHVDAGSLLAVSGFGAGTYSLTGGVLEIGGSNTFRARYNNVSSDYAFNLGGGTVRASGSAFVTDVVPTLLSGTTSTIDTNGLGATFSNGFSGTGGFAKTGDGILYVGGATVLAADSSVVGVMSLTGAGASFTVNSGATLALTSGSAIGPQLRIGVGTDATFTNLGDITLHDTYAAGSTSNRGAIRVGVDGGTGVLNTSGDITLTVGAATWNMIYAGFGAGATGTVNQTDGTVALGGAGFRIGYQGSAGSFATGAYHMTGDALLTTDGGASALIGDTNANGTVTISDSARFRFGTSDNVAGQFQLGVTAGSSGAFVQSGAASEVSVFLGSNQLVIGGGGAGSYTLHDGSLLLVTTHGNGIIFAASSGSAGSFVQNGGTSVFEATTLTVGSGGSGTFTVNDGVATVRASMSLGAGAASSGTLTLNGGVFEIGGTDGLRKRSGTSAFNLSGGTLRVIGSSLTSNMPGTLTAGKQSTIDTNGFDATFSAGIAGPGSLVKSGAGVLSLGTGASSVGALTLSGGGVSAGSLSATSFIVESGDLDADLSGGVLIKNTAGTVALSGGNAHAYTVVNAGTLVAAGAGSLGSGDVTVAASATLRIASAGATLANTFSGSGALTIAATGSPVTLSGDLGGFTGTTRILGGSTLVAGTAASPVSFGGSLRVDSGATFIGAATFGGAVVVAGDHRLGSAPAVAVFNAGLTYEAGSVLTLTFSAPETGPAVAGADFDRITVNAGGLTIAEGAKLVLRAYGAVDYSQAFWTEERAFLLVDASGFTGIFDVDTDGANTGAGPYGSWSVDQDGSAGEIVAQWSPTPVPEPSAYGFAGAGLAALAIAARRRRRV